MKMKDAIILAQDEITFLLTFWRRQIYQVKTEIFYEGQIPNAGHVLLKGEILLKKGRKLIRKVHAGEIIGLKELIDRRPAPYTAHIAPQSEVIIVDKSTASEIFGHQQVLTKLPNLVSNINLVAS